MLCYSIWQKCRDISLSYLREYERSLRKIEKLSLDISFLRNCLELQIFPQFVQFRVPYALQGVDCRPVKRKVLRVELRQKEKLLNSLKKSTSTKDLFIKSRISFLRYAVLKTLISRYLRRRIATWKRTLDKKLFGLWVRQRPRSPESIINQTDHILTVQERNALRFGLNHHIPPRSVDRYAILCSFERFVRSTNNQDRQFYQRLRQFSSQYIHTAQNECNTISNKALHRTLNLLRKNQDVKICRFDKGSGTVLLKKDDYYKKLDSIVLSSKFVEVPAGDIKHHPVLKTESSIQYFLNQYIKQHVNADTYKKIYPSGCQPGAIYGLAKVHKAGTPLRPVISMIKTPQYGLAKFLDSIIKPIIPHEFMLSSTAEFLSRTKNLNFQNAKLVSYDVESLFTNVPLNEVIDIACEFVYADDSPTKPTFERKHFKKLLQIATSGEFLYKDRIYKQLDGVAMGSPLGPTLANLFLASMESNWVSSPNAPLCYLRYVDDIFAMFSNDRDDAANFLQYLNSRHEHLRFTMEIGPKSLPFLDTMLDISDQNLNVSVYRKPTHTGLLMNFSAYSPIQWKFGVIRCLLHRAYKVCTSWQLFHSEVDKLRRMFAENNYPIKIFNSVVDKFMSSVLTSGRSSGPEQAVDSCITLVLPFFGNASRVLQQQMKLLCRRHGINYRIVFKPFKISQYFSLKSRCPSPLQSMIVYQFSCSKDSSITYIGKTKRHLISRIKEHTSVTCNSSAVFNHIGSCNCQVDLNNFKILYHCTSDYDLSICEALHIRDLQPTLNTSLTGQGQSLFLKL